MAKPKVKVLVNLDDSLSFIDIYADDLEKHLSEVSQTEGVLDSYLADGGQMVVKIDLRYDRQEIADELEDLLLAKVSEPSKD